VKYVQCTQLVELRKQRGHLSVCALHLAMMSLSTAYVRGLTVLLYPGPKRRNDSLAGQHATECRSVVSQMGTLVMSVGSRNDASTYMNSIFWGIWRGNRLYFGLSRAALDLFRSKTGFIHRAWPVRTQPGTPYFVHQTGTP
jgi:hypothetical protein